MDSTAISKVEFYIMESRQLVVYVFPKEPSRLVSDGDNSRPDLQVVIGGEQVLVDVTIGNPTCQTYQDQCSEEQLKCTVMAEQWKTNKYSAMAETQMPSLFHLPLKCMVDWGNLPRSYLTRFPSVLEIKC